MAETEKTERTIAPIGSKSAVPDEAAAPVTEPSEPAPMMDDEEYERLLDMYDVSFKNFAEGEVVRGIVLQVSDTEVIVDVGYKSEGIIPIDEFRDDTGTVVVEIDDDDWKGIEVFPETRVEIAAEVDQEGQTTELDVDSIRLAE